MHGTLYGTVSRVINNYSVGNRTHTGSNIMLKRGASRLCFTSHMSNPTPRYELAKPCFGDSKLNFGVARANLEQSPNGPPMYVLDGKSSYKNIDIGINYESYTQRI